MDSYFRFQLMKEMTEKPWKQEKYTSITSFVFYSNYNR